MHKDKESTCHPKWSFNFGRLELFSLPTYSEGQMSANSIFLNCLMDFFMDKKHSFFFPHSVFKSSQRLFYCLEKSSSCSSSHCLSVFPELRLDLFMKSLLGCDTSHLRSVRSAGISQEEHLFSWPAGDSQKFWPHRSPSAVKLLSPDCIYACVITTTRWQVADRWQIDGPCPWARTVGTWPLHPNYINTEGFNTKDTGGRFRKPQHYGITCKYIFHTKVSIWILTLSLPGDLCRQTYNGTSFLIWLFWVLLR